MSNKSFKRVTVCRDVCIICSSKEKLTGFDCRHFICASCQSISKQYDICIFCQPSKKTKVENPPSEEKTCWNQLSYYSGCFYIKGRE